MGSTYVCPGCGLDYDTISPPDADVALRSFPRRYRAAMEAAMRSDSDAPGGPGEAWVRRRPDPDTWSALEYTAHVADLFSLFADVVRRMYDESEPTLDFWDADVRAAEQGYRDQEPADVLDRLDAEADRLVTAVARVDAAGWRRTATFPFGERDLLMMVRNAVHEGSHHLRDVQRVLESTRGR